MQAALNVKTGVSTILPYVRMMRPYNSPAASFSLLAGFFLFKSDIDWLLLASAIAITIFLHSAVTIQNDIYDVDIDRANSYTDGLAGSKATIERAKLAIALCVAAAVLLSYFSKEKNVFIAYAALSLLAGWLYNSPPVQLSHRPVSSLLLLALYYSTLPMVFGVILGGGNLLKSLPFVIFLGLGRLSVSILKDFKDIAGDRQYGKRTFLLRFGRDKVVHLSHALCLAGNVAILVLASQKLEGILSLALFSLAIVCVLYALNLRSQLRESVDNKVLAMIFRKSFLVENVFNLIMAAVFLSVWA